MTQPTSESREFEACTEKFDVFKARSISEVTYTKQLGKPKDRDASVKCSHGAGGRRVKKLTALYRSMSRGLRYAD